MTKRVPCKKDFHLKVEQILFLYYITFQFEILRKIISGSNKLPTACPHVIGMIYHYLHVITLYNNKHTELTSYKNISHIVTFHHFNITTDVLT